MHTMAVNVETLDKLERRITLTLPAQAIEAEVQTRLKKLARTTKADGFRPGKVPMSVVSQRYGYSVHYEVMNDKVSQAFIDATAQAQLRVAGAPSITEKIIPEQLDAQMLSFEATFEVYPEVKLGELGAVEVERVSTDVTDAAVEKTIDILRKQRRTFSQRAQAEGAALGDRVTIDFEGKIDGVAFEGGTAHGFQFLIGEGQMLEAFEKAVHNMTCGESKTFPLQFPDDYPGKEVAGKEADFLVTVKKIENQQLPALDAAFVDVLGIKGATVEALRTDIQRNLEREVKFRVLARNKTAAMQALASVAELDLPTSLVQREIENLISSARADLQKRGIKEAQTLPIGTEIFEKQAQDRVRLGLAAAELIKANQLNARPEQLQAHIEELSQSYEKPADVMHWYLSDRKRMADVESVVIENNITEFVLSKAKIVDKNLPFDELMAN
jgi:trigger factor